MSQPSAQASFEQILEYLRQARAFDFTAYKRSSLMRRVVKRMQAVEIDGFEDYLDHLQIHADEFAHLFNTILINVTSFFRDPDVWETLRTTALPQMIERIDPSVPIRVWSAGCASGEEAYSSAIILAEILGIEAFRDRVKIYATDVDEEALREARQAVYSGKHVADVPEAYLEKYFDRQGDSYSFSRDLRRCVIFGRHDLIQNAPISRVDLLLCRNTLMYFNADAQSRILARFSFSLNAGGLVVLGRAEMLFSHAAVLSPVDLKRRVFTAVPKVNHRERQTQSGQPGREDVVRPDADHVRLQNLAFETAGEPQIMLDPSSSLLAANAAVRRTFGLGHGDIGLPLQELELSYRPAELRAGLQRAHEQGRDVTLKDVAWERDGTTRFLDIILSPLYDEDRVLLGTRISFHDVTPLKSLKEELSQSKQRLETASEELQSTNEELETTNEELQSTVEELETTNEELQSTNEELETMNEELQSTNEELQTMNDELRSRGIELNSTNAFMDAVFASLRSAVVVVDREMRVQVWNAGAADLWGLRPDETQNASFFGLDIGLPVGELHQPIREALGGTAPHRTVTLASTNRKGKFVQCRVVISPLVGEDRVVNGAILLMDEQPAG